MTTKQVITISRVATMTHQFADLLMRTIILILMQILMLVAIFIHIVIMILRIVQMNQELQVN